MFFQAYEVSGTLSFSEESMKSSACSRYLRPSAFCSLVLQNLQFSSNEASFMQSETFAISRGRAAS